MLIRLEKVANCPKGAKSFANPNFRQLMVDGLDVGVVSQSKSWTGMTYLWTTKIWCHDGRVLEGKSTNGDLEGQESSLLRALGVVIS